MDATSVIGEDEGQYPLDDEDLAMSTPADPFSPPTAADAPNAQQQAVPPGAGAHAQPQQAFYPQQPQPGYIYPVAQAVYVADPRPMSGLGVAGFILPFCGLAIVGLFLSIAGMKETRPDGPKKGRGLTVAGLVINIVSLAFFVVAFIPWLFFVVGFMGSAGHTSTY